MLQYYLAIDLLFRPVQTFAQQPPVDSGKARSAPTRPAVDTDAFTVDHLDLGQLALGTNHFTALIANKKPSSITVGISLRAVPGLWVRGNWQRGYRFEIPGNSSRLIEAEYVFVRMTPEATLRLLIGPPHENEDGISIPVPVYDTTFVVGRGNPNASDPRASFDTMSTTHLDIFAWRASKAARQLPAIAAARELAIRRIARLLDVPFTGRVRLVFYPDSATKTTQTGHVGAGFASGHTIVEIFNDSVQLDPYHEIAHIIASEIGSPPAVLREGFAVYSSELLGADALKYLGSPGKTVAQAVCAAQRADELLPLTRLFRFTDIGSDSTLPTISYPQAASVVAFLIHRNGIARFRELYGQLRNTTTELDFRRNEEAIKRSYGSTLETVEAAWRAQLSCRP